jgi:AraC-like DNA-binding protein
MRFFKRCTGVSCGDYIKSYRLEQAARRFSAGEQSILDVALSVGFHNLSYFYRAFRAKYGMTPKEFIRRCCEKSAASEETAP